MVFPYFYLDAPTAKSELHATTGRCKLHATIGRCKRHATAGRFKLHATIGRCKLHAPTGQNAIAQGNALGKRFTKILSPEGAKFFGGEIRNNAPSGLMSPDYFSPRALPWAITWRSFRAFDFTNMFRKAATHRITVTPRNISFHILLVYKDIYHIFIGSFQLHLIPSLRR